MRSLPPRLSKSSERGHKDHIDRGVLFWGLLTRQSLYTYTALSSQLVPAPDYPVRNKGRTWWCTVWWGRCGMGMNSYSYFVTNTIIVMIDTYKGTYISKDEG
jgi:hypothetical protein